jgi:peptide/nickel transport system substrate-binding protein
MKHMKKSLILVLLLALCVCITPQAGADDKYGGTLTISSPATISSLYTIMVTGNAHRIVWPAVEQLGRLQLDGTYKPFLCESWDRDNKALTFTLNLNKGIKFSDGSELTAEVVKWNFEMMLKSGMVSALCDPKEFEVVSKYSLRVHFKVFSLDWENNYGACFIYSKKCYDEKGEDYAKIHPVGTGPFVLNQYLPDTYLHFKRNKNYWQKGLPYLDRLNIEIMPDVTTRQTAFVNGEIDQIFGTEAPMIKFLEGRGYKNKAVKIPSTMHYFSVWPNSTLPPFDNPDVRKAILLYGLDWKAIAAGCTEGFGWPGLQLAVPGCYDYNPEIEKASQYDLAKAKAMLKKAGYGDGFETEITFAHPVYSPLAAAIQDQLRRNFNITANVNLTRAASKMRAAGDTPGLNLVHVGGFLDPTTYITTRMNRKGLYGKLMAFSDAYEAALDEVRGARTIDDKKKALQKLNRILYVDDCLGRNGYMTGDYIFLKDHVHDSGLETSIYTPEITYLKK